MLRGYLTARSRVLDLGTGGGEAFSAWSSHLGRGLGIDRSEERIRVAQTDRRRRNDQRIEFALMDGALLAVRDGSMDVVLARKADYEPAEVARVLAPGGVFLTLQMGDHDTQNIFDAFAWGSYGSHWRSRFEAQGRPYRPVPQTADEFRALGCDVLAYEESNTRQYFHDVASLVLWLKASPLPEPFDPHTHADALTRLIADYGSERGIETNAHRELLVVKKR
jgi:SAM-dependent methyltransferase